MTVAGHRPPDAQSRTDRIALPARPAWAIRGPGDPDIATAFLAQLNLGRLFAGVTIAAGTVGTVFALMVAVATGGR